MTETLTGYKIGKAAQLTGISPDKLRIWERRYAVVNPIRTKGGGRLYGVEDISRLKIIKSLIDSGDSIGNIATLNLDELQLRIADESQDLRTHSHQGPVRIAIVGGSLSAKFTTSNKANVDIDIVASHTNRSALLNTDNISNVDVLIFEKSALQEENIQQVLDLMDQINASHTIIVYRFASQDTLNRLPKANFLALRAPLDINTLTEYCRSLFVQNLSARSHHNKMLESDYPIAPARRYDDETLAKLVELSSTIKCECPHHLAELVFALTAFEKYSSDCENLNLEDSELHAYLGNATAKARHIIENALEKVLELEDIQI